MHSPTELTATTLAELAKTLIGLQRQRFMLTGEREVIQEHVNMGIAAIAGLTVQLNTIEAQITSVKSKRTWEMNRARALGMLPPDPAPRRVIQPWELEGEDWRNADP